VNIKYSILTAFLCLIYTQTKAEGQKTSVGGFIDAQYAFDFNAPRSGDRVFTTQPARHNEFNINLAFVDMKYDTDKIRSRIALQAGTSVQANYSSEPTNGAVSGGDLSRHIQEARIGYKISDKTWIDGGIFFAHVGAEGWISKDNLTLTRSLVADFSPYYLSGIKISHAATDRLNLLLTVTNGWQNISENNQDKNIGTGVEYSFDSLSLAYNTLIGREISSPLNSLIRTGQLRHFHDFVIKSRGLQNWEWVAQYDIGFQKSESASGEDHWQGALLMARYQVSTSQKISARVEYYQDLNQIILVTNTPQSFEGYGGSVGFDNQLEENILFRLEARYLQTSNKIFPKNLDQFVDSNFTLTTSLSMQF
jgi:hypothetical protein